GPGPLFHPAPHPSPHIYRRVCNASMPVLIPSCWHCTFPNTLGYGPAASARIPAGIAGIAPNPRLSIAKNWNMEVKCDMVVHRGEGKAGRGGPAAVVALLAVAGLVLGVWSA